IEGGSMSFRTRQVHRWPQRKRAARPPDRLTAMQPKNAALLLLLTAVGGQALLHWRGKPDVAPGAVAFRVADPAGLARQQHLAATRNAEVGEGEMVDLDRATAGELVRLPGVGPSLAKRIVVERDRNGPFGGPSCLDARVPGVGEGFLQRTGPHLRFSAGGCGGGAPAEGGNGAQTPSSGGGGCPEVVDLNRATQADLVCLPGIGAARAEAILA
ncbi:MAG: helix-hairpin-helix domain-containing protein, partial [Gemmatimonadetes bacterium]|nr:helix-hairpin-helix domain-containing protein [Gemmatimonadota bacterium]